MSGGLTTDASTGFSSITRISPGAYLYTFSEEQNDTNYVVVATRTISNPLEGDCVVTEQTTTSFKIASSNDNSTPADPTGLNVIALRITQVSAPSTQDQYVPTDNDNEAQESNSGPAVGGFIDCVQCLHESGTTYSHQYQDFDPDTQVCVVITSKDEGGSIYGFPNLRLVPVSDNGSSFIHIVPGSSGVNPIFPIKIYVTRAGKLITNATVGVLRFRKPTQEF